MRALLLIVVFMVGLAFNAEAAEPFAVVELFASEGCSSSPPADRLLSQLTEEARKNHKRVYTLSFQVDYWNKLGWVDPFSRPAFSNRQHAYAKVLKGKSVYTPQIIVNGEREFVGSNQLQVRHAVDKVLQKSTKEEITLKLKKTEEGIEVIYASNHPVPNAVINIALVERGLESHVTDGENAGEILKHDNIVRQFQTRALKETNGRVLLDSPESEGLSQFSVITYVQDASNWRVLAANSIDL